MVERARTICIVGLGLMGGSLALALRHSRQGRARVLAVSRKAEVLAAARSAGAIDKGTSELAEGISEADMIVLSTPVRTIMGLLPEVGNGARPGAIVLDMGSSKSRICAAMNALPPELEPIGGHPMCGKEVSGFAAADAELFRGRPFVLCPLPRTAPDALEQAIRLASDIGAQPVVMDPAVHDRAVAGVSHLPYTAAVALINCVAAANDPVAWSLASSGFRDTTRLGGSEVDMMLDILLTNREPVIDWLGQFSLQLDLLHSALTSGDEGTLRSLLTPARELRARLSLQPAAAPEHPQ
jgi:prephenate dehydrogenase